MVMLRVDVITIFPGFFRDAFDYGILNRARDSGLVQINAHDLRRWTTDKHHTVDDRPFGGGDGMVLKAEPIFSAVGDLTGSSRREDYPKDVRVILLSPQGQVFNQSLAEDLSRNASQIVLICGRYEGVDERVAEALVTDEISIGDYVLSGGEPAALATSRQDLATDVRYHQWVQWVFFWQWAAIRQYANERGIKDGADEKERELD